jgi:glutamate synthase domain-containing protein 3
MSVGIKEFAIDAKGLHYRELNEKIREAVKSGETEIKLVNVNGQRYIGDAIDVPVSITMDGVPGADLGAFMNGPTINVYANTQDHVANTMNEGKIIIHGDAGDVLGYAMRGGKLFVKGDVGYRVGIHMKEYMDKVPVAVIGGTAGDFFGEYMAGGMLILLGLDTGHNGKDRIAGNYFGTGMHGGVIYLRGELEDYQLGKEVAVLELDDNDRDKIKMYVTEFAADVGLDADEILKSEFVKIKAVSHRPYGNLYAY